MIVGVGVDLVEIARIRAMLERWGERFLHRVYLPEEIAYANTLADPTPALAARFAAKEAFIKAYPGYARLSWVGVARTEKPRLVFQGPLDEEIKKRGLTPWVSLSHEREHAVAVVVLEASGPPSWPDPRSSESSP